MSMTFQSQSTAAKIVLLLAGFGMLTACPRDKDAAPVFTPGPAVVGAPPANPQALIERIERLIELPNVSGDPTGPLSGFTRRYSWTYGAGPTSTGGTVYGVLERIGDGPRDAQWIDGPISEPADGGCAVIVLRYNVAGGRIEDIRCNGSS